MSASTSWIKQAKLLPLFGVVLMAAPLVALPSWSLESRVKLAAAADSDDDTQSTDKEATAAAAEAEGKTPAQIKSIIMGYLRKPNAGLLRVYINKLPPMTDDQSFACLDALVEGYSDPSAVVRGSAHTLVSALVVGKWPSYLENRLGDQSEHDLSTKGPDIERQHEQFVQDIRDFMDVSDDKKSLRSQVLNRLLKRPTILSDLDKADIARQLDELSWSKEVLERRLASAEVMLAFNYHYFEGLSAKQKILKSLKDALSHDNRLVTDTVFLETAKGGLAQTDSGFMQAFKKAAGKDFDPAAVGNGPTTAGADAGKTAESASTGGATPASSGESK